jgi:enamine deaminase RidA (YjgF/YER057c/UK114 family)
MSLAIIDKRTTTGLDVITLKRDSLQEYFITAVPKGDEPPDSLFSRVGEAIRKLDGPVEILSAESLGVSSADGAAKRMQHTLADGQGLPLGWVESSGASNLYGVHVWAAGGGHVQHLRHDGRIVGSLFEDRYARYCRIIGLLPTDASHPRADQASQIFHQMEGLLHGGQMEFLDVFRTWFYNDDILGWYRDFNGVRTQFFRDRGVPGKWLPASTGVDGRNGVGAALTAGLIAVKPKGDGVKVSEVLSPLQPPAPDYGSSFSRAVEVETPDLRRLYVSGTASIDRDGKTVFVGDCAAQVRRTLEVVQAILESRGMDWSDVVRSLAYFRQPEEAPLFGRYLADSAIPRFPAIVLGNGICRDDLLFEIEVDAIKSSSH